MTKTTDATVVRAVLTKADDRSVEQHVGYDGLLMVVATNGASDVSFAFARSGGGVELTEVRGDSVTPHGCFTDMMAALGVVVRSIAQA